MTERAAPPKDIAPPMKAYAFERSLGMPPAEACRRAGGKVENGQATKWERNKGVLAWLAYYRSLGCEAEMIAAKRARLEERLALAAFGNIFDFATMKTRIITVQKGEDETEEHIVETPIIDWDKVAASPYGAIISGFKFDKDTGELVDFERDPALQAIAQLRDMHGFKAPAKAEFAGPGGGPIPFQDVTMAERARALVALFAKAQEGGAKA